MQIDIERLRKDMINQCMGAAFGGGSNQALLLASELEKASNQELINKANNYGVRLSDYEIN